MHIGNRTFSQLFIILFLFSGLCYAQESSDKLSTTGKYISELSSFDETVIKIIKMTNAPGAALAIGRKGELILSRGYGIADTVSNVKVQPDSQFRIASVSKPITAVAILKLVEQGKLSLYDQIINLLNYNEESFELSDKRMNRITVQDLLYHSGGWDREQSGFDPPFAADRIAIALGKEPPATRNMIIRFMLTQPLNFDPGLRQSYSNLGYAILGHIIESITKQSYEQYVQNEIFKPIGADTFVMGRSLQSNRYQDEVRYHDSRKFFSVYPGQGMVPAPYGAFSIEAMDSHGGWISSAPDLVRFMAALDFDITTTDILKENTIKEMVSPHPKVEVDSTYYGMGWHILQKDNDLIWYHMGDLPGTTAFILKKGSVYVALLLNGNAGSRENADRLLPLLLNTILNVDKWPNKESSKF